MGVKKTLVYMVKLISLYIKTCSPALSQNWSSHPAQLKWAICIQGLNMGVSGVLIRGSFMVVRPGVDSFLTTFSFMANSNGDRLLYAQIQCPPLTTSVGYCSTLNRVTFFTLRHVFCVVSCAEAIFGLLCERSVTLLFWSVYCYLLESLVDWVLYMALRAY